MFEAGKQGIFDSANVEKWVIHVERGRISFFDSTETNGLNTDQWKAIMYKDYEQDIEVIPDSVSDFTFSVYSMYESEGLSYNESVKEWQKDFKNIRFSIKTIYQDETEKEQLYGMGFSSETSERPLLCELIKR